MITYTIKPMKVGSIFNYRGAFTSIQDQYKEREEFPVLAFLIEGNGHKILVDTGCGDSRQEELKISYHGPSSRSDEESLDNVLYSMGIDTSEIDIVIITHLHWDHCYNNHLFPNALFYVQRAEMMGAIDPAPKYRITYEAFTTGVVPPWARQATKWKLINGDYDLIEGIRLLLLPGHSKGLMGVLIDTEKGKYLLASDAVPLYENIGDIVNNQYLISSYCENVDAYYASFEKIRATNAVIIPSHDFKVLEYSLYPVRKKEKHEY